MREMIPTYRWTEAVFWRGLAFSTVVVHISLPPLLAAPFGMLAVMRLRWDADG
jgi:hypothetical protein